MSIGFCGDARLIARNDEALVYAYRCYNLNHPDWQAAKERWDGKLWLGREIPRNMDMEKLLREGKVQTINASAAWMTVGASAPELANVDVIAVELLRKLLNEYQATGQVPGKVSYCV